VIVLLHLTQIEKISSDGTFIDQFGPTILARKIIPAGCSYCAGGAITGDYVADPIESVQRHRRWHDMATLSDERSMRGSFKTHELPAGANQRVPVIGRR